MPSGEVFQPAKAYPGRTGIWVEITALPPTTGVGAGMLYAGG